MKSGNVSFDLKRFVGIKRDYTKEEVEKLNNCRNFLKALHNLSGKNTYTMHETQQIYSLTKNALKGGRNSTIMPNKDFIKNEI